MPSNARIVAPRDALPVTWRFVDTFPESRRGAVRAGAAHWNGLVSRRSLLEDPAAGVVTVALASAPHPKGGKARYLPGDQRIIFYPVWDGLWWAGDYRRELFARHEFGHALGFGHSDLTCSLMNANVGRWWFVGCGRELDQSEVEEFWRNYG